MDPITYVPRMWDGFLTDQSKQFIRFYEAEETALNAFVKTYPTPEQIEDYQLEKAARYRAFLVQMIGLTDAYTGQIQQNSCKT